jgi:hypothetical protein
MASYKYSDAPFMVESPDVTYTDDEIIAHYTYETVSVHGGKVSKRGLDRPALRPLQSSPFLTWCLVA